MLIECKIIKMAPDLRVNNELRTKIWVSSLIWNDEFQRKPQHTEEVKLDQNYA